MSGKGYKEMNRLGKGFEMYLDFDFRKRTIISTGYGGSELIVIRPPKKRQGLHWDFLRYITFGKYFQPIKTHYVRWKGNNIKGSIYRTKRRYPRYKI